MGTPEISAEVFEAMILDGYKFVGLIAQPDRPVGRKGQLEKVPTKVVAEKYNIPVFQPVKIRKEYDFVNYFDFNDAFAKLLKDGSITKNQEDEDSYSITKKGEIIAKELERKLPLTVREKAIAATINLLARLKREKENSSSIKKANNGYYFSGNISGGGEINLMSFSLCVPDELQAKLIKRNFQNYPEKVYECLLAVLTKNNNMINNILEEIKSDIAENA